MNYTALPQNEADFQKLRRKLITFFVGRRLFPAEDFADEVFERVVIKLSQGEKIENINNYVFGVAKFVYLETFRQPKNAAVDSSGAIVDERDETNIRQKTPSQLIVMPFAENEETAEIICLRKCLGELPPEKRQLLIEFYEIKETEKTHIEQRKELAERNGMRVDTLYTAICRLRKIVGECVKLCAAE